VSTKENYIGRSTGKNTENFRFHLKIQKSHGNCTQNQKENAEKPAFARLFGIVMFIPTRWYCIIPFQ
jgi:hypothetical protein